MKYTRKHTIIGVLTAIFLVVAGVVFYAYQEGDFNKYKYHFDEQFRAKVDSFNLNCPLSIGICGYIKNLKIPVEPVEHSDSNYLHFFVEFHGNTNVAAEDDKECFRQLIRLQIRDIEQQTHFISDMRKRKIEHFICDIQGTGSDSIIRYEASLNQVVSLTHQARLRAQTLKRQITLLVEHESNLLPFEIDDGCLVVGESLQEGALVYDIALNGDMFSISTMTDAEIDYLIKDALIYSFCQDPTFTPYVFEAGLNYLFRVFDVSSEDYTSLQIALPNAEAKAAQLNQKGLNAVKDSLTDNSNIVFHEVLATREDVYPADSLQTKTE